KIFVSCVNMDKGGVAKKACEVACIGCKACVKVCAYDAITVDNFLAYIDPNLCKLCRKCVEVCPTDAILEINFPPRKIKTETTETVETKKVETSTGLSADKADPAGKKENDNNIINKEG
ncbi:MAG: 4Fe-4S binding protein, partial [Bacteroidales bacterium]|nr:4Fe-4S binding protein [Bacteroidales bacterium]